MWGIKRFEAEAQISQRKIRDPCRDLNPGPCDFASHALRTELQGSHSWWEVNFPIYDVTVWDTVYSWCFLALKWNLGENISFLLRFSQNQRKSEKMLFWRENKKANLNFFTITTRSVPYIAQGDTWGSPWSILNVRLIFFFWSRWDTPFRGFSIIRKVECFFVQLLNSEFIRDN